MYEEKHSTIGGLTLLHTWIIFFSPILWLLTGYIFELLFGQNYFLGYSVFGFVLTHFYFISCVKNNSAWVPDDPSQPNLGCF